MKTLRIHLIWACVAAVSAAAGGKWALHTRDEATMPRRGLLPQRPDAPAAATIPPTGPVDEPAVPQPPLPSPALAKPEYEIRTRLLSLEEIRRRIHGKDRRELWEACQAVGLIAKGPLKTELIRELLKSEDDGIRQSALSLLCESVTEESAAPTLQELLRTDPSGDVRKTAARYISGRAPGDVEALLHAFEKEDLPTQVICAGLLGKMGHAGPAAQLVPRLAAAMESPDGLVRREAAEHLSRLHTAQALPLLARALRDSNGDVRLEAVSGLWGYEDTWFASLLEPLLDDPVRAVRESARELYDNAKGRQE